MSKNFVSASLVVLGLAAWLGSGYLGIGTPDSPEPGPSNVAPVEGIAAMDNTDKRVRVTLIASETRTRHAVLRGRTQSKRTVDVKAEIAGAIVARPVERGMRVQAGDLLCEIATDDREVAVQEARAALQTARIEHQGSLRLKQQNLLSDVAIAASEARQEAALATLLRQELNMARTRIVAPFSGVVESLHMNIGDYATPGTACATLIDLDPMLIVAHVTEAEVQYIAAGQSVAGETANGRELEGSISFVGMQSDRATRTYPVEITVDNADYSIRSGLTVALRVGVEQVSAHQVSPSLLTLNDAGELGLRIVDNAHRVAFRTVDILENGADGLWIRGLPTVVNLITVGQEYVAVGDIVEPVFGNNQADQLANL